jgi:integrase
MRLDPKQARVLLPRVDPGRLRKGVPVGLRDGALLALVAAGLSAVEIAALRGSAITMTGGRVAVAIAAQRDGIARTVILPTDLGARLLAWLTEGRLWGTETPVFIGAQGPYCARGVNKVFDRYRRRKSVRR